MGKLYKVEFSDEKFEILFALNDNEAIAMAKAVAGHRDIFNIFEIDADYNEIRTISIH